MSIGAVVPGPKTPCIEQKWSDFHFSPDQHWRHPFSHLDFPAVRLLPEIIKAVNENDCVIVAGPTGSAKTSIVNLALMLEGYKPVVTQPRRITARRAAQWAASLIGELAGESVGFRTAMEHCCSHRTRLLYVTEELQLVRELFATPGKRDLLVLDEQHKRPLSVDGLQGWWLEQNKAGRGPRLVIMTATPDIEKLRRLHPEAPIIQIPGRTFPIKELPPGESVEADAAQLLGLGMSGLIFQPGVKEINLCINRLKEMGVRAELIPLHSKLDTNEQDAVFEKYDLPKCVVATNIAELSVTIDDLDFVIDSGLENRIEVHNGIERLARAVISLSSREQRKGRVGRTKRGFYIDHAPCGIQRPVHDMPEILRVRLDQAVLRFAVAGLRLDKMQLMDTPPANGMKAARRSIRYLGLMDDEKQVTERGLRVSKLPCSLQSGVMLVEAERQGVLAEIASMVAIFEAGSVTSRTNTAWKRMVPEQDCSDLIAQYYALEWAGTLPAHQLRQYGISDKTLRRIVETRDHLLAALKLPQQEHPRGQLSEQQHLACLQSICAGLIEDVYFRRKSRWSRGEDARFLPSGSVVKDAYAVVGLPLDIVPRLDGEPSSKILRLATRFEREWLGIVAPALPGEYARGLKQHLKLAAREKGRALEHKGYYRHSRRSVRNYHSARKR